MKINLSNRLPVQSLGRQSNVQYDRSSEIIAGAIGDVIGTAAKAYGEAQKIKTERQNQQAGLFLQKVESEFRSEWDGKDLLDVNTLPNEVVTEGMITKGRVASAEVYPSMYRKTMDSAIKDASSIIEDVQARNKWLNNVKEVALRKYANVQSKANSDISNQIYKDQQINFKNALDQGRPDVALTIAEGMNADKAEVDSFKRIAKKGQETKEYDDSMVTENRKYIKEYIDFLGDKNYEKNGGQLNQGDRLVYKHKLENELTRLNRIDTAANNAFKESIRRELSIVTTNALNGAQSDPKYLLDLAGRVKLANSDGKMTAELQNFQAALVFSGGVNEINKQSRFERIDAINNYVKRSGLKGFEQEQLKSRLEKANEKLISSENEDLLQSAVDTGFIKQLAPINATNPIELSNQFAARYTQVKATEQNYRVFNNKLLTKSEAISFAGFINKLPADKQIPYFAAASAGLGDDAVYLYEQLGTDGGLTSQAIAGITATKSKQGSAQAEAILRGNEYRRKNKDEIDPVFKRAFMGDLDTDIGLTFFNKPGYQRAIKDAAFDAYIHYALNSGGDLKNIDSEAYKSALQAATGGILKYGGNKIQAPEYGMTQDQFDDWIERLSPKYIDKLGGLDGYKSSSFIKDLRDGNFTLTGTEYGSYIVSRTDGVPLKANNGGAFVLIYDPDAELEPKSTRRSRR